MPTPRSIPIVLLTLVLLAPRVGEARPPGAQSWSARSTGTRDRTVAIASDGESTYWLVANDGVATAEIRRFSTGGDQAPKIAIISGYQQLSLSSLAILGDTAYVAGAVSQSPFVAAYSMSTGQQVWSLTYGGGGSFQKIVIADGRIVVAGTLASKFFVAALSTTRAQLWSYQGAASSGASALAAGGGRVIAGGYPGFVVRSFDSTTGQLQLDSSTGDALGQVYDLVVVGNRAYATGGGATPLTRGFDLAAKTVLWTQATGAVWGTGFAIGSTGGLVFTTGRVAAGDATQAYVEARDAGVGVLRWIDRLAIGPTHRGTALVARGERVYGASVATSATGVAQLTVRAYGASNGYRFWSDTWLEPGGGGSTAMTSNPLDVIVADGQVGATSQAIVRAYEGRTAGGVFVQRSCPKRAGIATSVNAVAAVSGLSFVACTELVSPAATAVSTILALDSATGSTRWSYNLATGVPVGSSVTAPWVAAIGDTVYAIAVVHRPGGADPLILVRRFTALGKAGAPVVLAGEIIGVGIGVGEKTRIAARDGFVVAAATGKTGVVVAAYDVRSCAGSCRNWTHVIPGTAPEAVAVGNGRAAVGMRNPFLKTVVFDDLASHVAKPTTYVSTAPGDLHDLAITASGVFPTGTGQLHPHTYFAGGYQFGMTDHLRFYDDAPIPLPNGPPTSAGDAWGIVALDDDRIYACGYAIDKNARTQIVRGYASDGAPIWDPERRSGPGSCSAIAASPSRIFVVGDDSITGLTSTAFAVSSIDLAGQGDWQDRATSVACATGSCFATAVAAEGNYVVVGGRLADQSLIRIYQATCSAHGVETICPPR